MRAVAVALAVALAACRGGDKPRRASGTAPVEIVKQPLLPDAGGGHGGPISDEIEPNDSDDVATPLPLGGTVRGKLEPDTDVDRYRIDVDRAGALTVTTTAIDMDLALELEDGAGNIVARSDRGGVRVREGVPNFGVTPGRYTAVVRAVPKKKARPKKGKKPDDEPAKPAPVYEITAQLAAPAKGFELEPNDDRGTANDLLIGDPVAGYIGWTGDADVWKLSIEALSAKNVVAIEVAAVDGTALELQIADAAGQPLLAHKAARGDAASVHGLAPNVAAGAPPFVYLTVTGDRSNPETPYQLKATASVPNPDSELEPDDSPEHAFAVPADRTVVHAWFDVGDVDCFALAVAREPRDVQFAIDVPQELDLAAELFVDGKSVVKVDHRGRGVDEKLAAPVAAGARAVACVRAVGTVPAGGVGYDVHVIDSAAAGEAQ